MCSMRSGSQDKENIRDLWTDACPGDTFQIEAPTGRNFGSDLLGLH
jgi:hypothetical protein